MKLFRKLFCAFAILFAALSVNAADVCVVSREGGYYASLGKHLVRWLAQHSIKADYAQKDGLGKALTSSKMAFLIGYNEVSSTEMSQIRAFCSRGGRLVVFYSASPQLAQLMGVKLLGFKQATYPGQWSRMDFANVSLEGCPKSILQTSTVLQRAAPIAGKSQVIATWADRNGKSSNEPAWLVSSYGYWMTHVLLADGEENKKSQLVAAMVGKIVPRAWNYNDYLKRYLSEARKVRVYAESQKPRPGEIHAVWDHSGCGLYPGNWKKTIAVLKSSGVTDLFVNVAGAGFAHYPSDVLPRSKTYEQEGDQLKACLAAAKGSGIRVHAWVLCFTATRSTSARMEDFARKGWRLKTKSGTLSEYLDPSNAEVRNRILKCIEEIQVKYPSVAGIHLDFVRWYEQSEKPANADVIITRFVAAAKRKVCRPRWLTVAVLGKYPSCVKAVGQNWDAWLRANIVDYVVPMDYTEKKEKLEEFLKQHSMIKKHANKTIVGIGVTANESRLSASQVMQQINLVRKYKLPGVALFDLDHTLEKQILPYLKLGLWKK